MTDHQLLAVLVALGIVVSLAVWAQTIRLWYLTARILKETTDQTPAIKTTLDVAVELLRRTKQ
jgi:hypothetical protein